MAYIYSGILLSHKNNELSPFATTWFHLEGIMISQISKTEKDKYCVIHLYVESKNKTNKQSKQKRNRLLDTENKLVVARGEAKRGVG